VASSGFFKASLMILMTCRATIVDWPVSNYSNWPTAYNQILLFKAAKL
jgi:hypothetical protein